MTSLPQDLIDRVQTAYPDRKLSVEPWLAMWDPTGKLWYITPFDHNDQQVLYSEDGQCMARQDVETVCGLLHDATAEQLRRRQSADRAAEK